MPHTEFRTTRGKQFRERQWSIRRTVEPTGALPVSVAEAREAIGLACDDTSRDAELERLILDAEEFVETDCNVAIRAQTLELTLDRFPLEIELWRVPVTAVLSVKYIDPAGVEQTVDPSIFQVDTTSKPGRIRPFTEFFWPETDFRLNAVTVEFTAGPTDQPRAARLAMLMFLKCGDSDAYQGIKNRLDWKPV